MLTQLKTPQEVKNQLMSWWSDDQFAMFAIRIHQYQKDKDDFLSPDFIGWWYGCLDFGQSKNDNLHYELTKISRGWDFDGGDVYINNENFDYGYVRDYPSTDYYRAKGKSLLLYFNNQCHIGENEKTKLEYMLEITPLATL
jgi:hypothetical protein